jgi:hypothetical protein
MVVGRRTGRYFPQALLPPNKTHHARGTPELGPSITASGGIAQPTAFALAAARAARYSASIVRPAGDARREVGGCGDAPWPGSGSRRSSHQGRRTRPAATGPPGDAAPTPREGAGALPSLGSRRSAHVGRHLGGGAAPGRPLDGSRRRALAAPAALPPSAPRTRGRAGTDVARRLSTPRDGEARPDATCTHACAVSELTAARRTLLFGRHSTNLGRSGFNDRR